MLSSTITARIDAFTKELEKLVREAAVAAVQEALSPGAAPAAAAGRSPARSRSRTRARAKKTSAAKSAPAKRSPSQPKAAAATAKPAGGDAGSQKPTGEMDAATIAYVKGHPGLRLEEIAKALRVPSPSLKGRVAQLVEAKKLRKTGKTRGTKYFVP